MTAARTIRTCGRSVTSAMAVPDVDVVWPQATTVGPLWFMRAFENQLHFIWGDPESNTQGVKSSTTQ
jgi:hypothetical protein